jgi:hypothetical protein
MGERLRKDATMLGGDQRILDLHRQPRDKFAAVFPQPRLLKGDVAAPHFGRFARIREPGPDHDLIADGANLALHQVADVELAPERARIDRLPLVGPARGWARPWAPTASLFAGSR